MYIVYVHYNGLALLPLPERAVELHTCSSYHNSRRSMSVRLYMCYNNNIQKYMYDCMLCFGLAITVIKLHWPGVSENINQKAAESIKQ